MASTQVKARGRQRIWITTPSIVYAMVAILNGLFIAQAQAVPASKGLNAVRSSGCSAESRDSGELTLGAMDGNRNLRTYLVALPESYDPSHAYRVLFVAHGANGSAKQESETGLRTVESAAQDAIFVYPQGIPYKNDGIGWDDSSGGYDMPFFDNVLFDISAKFCVDTSRVFAEGFSWGGDFVTALSCVRGDKIRAVVAMSTTDEYREHSDYTSYQNYPCPGRKHPAILYIHAVDGDTAYPPPLFNTTSKLFKYMNSCGGGGSLLPPTSKIMACVAYDACSPGYTECFVDHGIGHAPPPNWAEIAWAFLSKF